MEEALQQYLASLAHAGGAASASKASHEARVEDARSAFDRVLARQVGVTVLSTAQGDAQKLNELQDLARQNRIDERLAQLKLRLQK
jgi:phage shock protein A